MASNVDIKLMAGLDIDSSIPQIKDDIAQIHSERMLWMRFLLQQLEQQEFQRACKSLPRAWQQCGRNVKMT